MKQRRLVLDGGGVSMQPKVLVDTELEDHCSGEIGTTGIFVQLLKGILSTASVTLCPLSLRTCALVVLV